MPVHIVGELAIRGAAWVRQVTTKQLQKMRAVTIYPCERSGISLERCEQYQAATFGKPRYTVQVDEGLTLSIRHDPPNIAISIGRQQLTTQCLRKIDHRRSAKRNLLCL
jgi:hypothetical protein